MILVTGGTGFIGRRLTAALAEADRPVRVLTRSGARPADLPAAIDVRTGDLLDDGSLDDALADIDTVIHLAGVVAAGRMTPDAARVNLEGTRNLARRARERGIAAFIHCSSAGVYGSGRTDIPHAETTPPHPETDYERSKLESEHALVEALDHSAVRWTILRPTGIHGPGRPATLSFYRRIAGKRLWVHGPSRMVVHPTHVDDLVRSICLVCDRRDLSGETFNIGGDRAITNQALIDMVARAMNHHIAQLTLPRITRAGASLCRIAMQGIGLTPVPVLDRLARPIVNRAVDNSKARRELGFAPIDLEQGVKTTVEWFSRQGLL
jgi:nucleoside-diphosphate-sugar epimerase